MKHLNTRPPSEEAFEDDLIERHEEITCDIWGKITMMCTALGVVGLLLGNAVVEWATVDEAELEIQFSLPSSTCFQDSDGSMVCYWGGSGQTFRRSIPLPDPDPSTPTPTDPPTLNAPDFTWKPFHEQGGESNVTTNCEDIDGCEEV